MEVAVRDRGHGLLGAVDRAAVGMVGEGRGGERLPGDRVGILGIAPEVDQELAADALDRLGIEAGLVERQAQQLEGLVLVLDQGREAAVELVAPGIEGKLHGKFVEAVLEGLAVELARTLVEQARDHVGDAGPVGGIEGGAATEGEVERQDRDRRLVLQPDLDAGGRREGLDAVGTRRGGEGKDGKDEQQGGLHGLTHRRLPGAAGRRSLRSRAPARRARPR